MGEPVDLNLTIISYGFAGSERVRVAIHNEGFRVRLICTLSKFALNINLI